MVSGERYELPVKDYKYRVKKRKGQLLRGRRKEVQIKLSAGRTYRPMSLYCWAGGFEGPTNPHLLTKKRGPEPGQRGCGRSLSEQGKGNWGDISLGQKS